MNNRLARLGCMHKSTPVRGALISAAEHITHRYNLVTLVLPPGKQNLPSFATFRVYSEVHIDHTS